MEFRRRHGGFVTSAYCAAARDAFTGLPTGGLRPPFSF